MTHIDPRRAKPPSPRSAVGRDRRPTERPRQIGLRVHIDGQSALRRPWRKRRRDSGRKSSCRFRLCDSRLQSLLASGFLLDRSSYAPTSSAARASMKARSPLRCSRRSSAAVPWDATCEESTRLLLPCRRSVSSRAQSQPLPHNARSNRLCSAWFCRYASRSFPESVGQHPTPGFEASCMACRSKARYR